MITVTNARIEIVVRLRIARQLLKEASAAADPHGALNMAREQLDEVEEDIRIVQSLVAESEVSNG